MFAKRFFLLLVLLALVVTVPAQVYADDLFGSGQGYIHPSLSVTTEYDDNYKETAAFEETDWTTTISPEIWLSLPASQRTFVRLTSSNDAPGGQGVTRFQDQVNPGFQGSLGYRADFERSHDHSEDDSTYQRGQALLQYSLPVGLTFELSDVYQTDKDDYAKGNTAEREEYASNLINAIAYYQVSPLLKLRGGYSNYKLDYKSTGTSFRERTDDQFSSYILYQLLPKTELFVQFDYIDTNYQQNILSDTTQQNYFVGLKFDSNARILGYLKLGYGDTEVDQGDDYSDLIGAAELSYDFLDNNRISLNWQQAVHVSTEAAYQSILYWQWILSLERQINDKVSASINAGFKQDEFRGGSAMVSRTDEFFEAGLACDYEMQDWLSLGVEYNYVDRDSNLDTNDYRSNRVIMSLTAAF